MIGSILTVSKSYARLEKFCKVRKVMQVSRLYRLLAEFLINVVKY